jgi:DNA-binding transcriptional MerR regulator
MPPLVLADYISRRELAAELGVHERTLTRWEAMGEAPPKTRVGRRPMYRRVSVAAWLARREETVR